MDTVNAAQAARLAGVSARTINQWLRTGKIPGAVKVQRPGRPAEWQIDPEQLPKSINRNSGVSDSLDERISALEREVARLRRLLEGTQAAPSVRTPPRQAEPSESQRSALQRHPVLPAGDALPDRAAAARWLERHGVNRHTPQTWSGWVERFTESAYPLEPRAILEDALARVDPTNWRITWRLSRCDDPTCPCHELLAE